VDIYNSFQNEMFALATTAFEALTISSPLFGDVNCIHSPKSK